ncbi:TldD/PmbA family protein [Sporanaerobacter acetigenes]|uniref:TldD protein n=1 Tax=Sporanaerobacter acetigenes DSM 13106 TaxID=1123281 RepID=A0A1M5ZBH1_9FIRM|nr:TldD/PmbA family protein [Sporanaerobacter acetigenes]SHI21566.1 TldD protein [Sporanaerobacter acetigenes DSM 13106]
MIGELKKLMKNIDLEYGEIRIEIRNKEGCSFRNRTLENLTKGYELGGMVRVFNNSNWAYVSFNSFKDIKEAINKAKQITYLYDKTNRSMPSPVYNRYYEHKKFVDEISLKERKNLLSRQYEYILKHEFIEKCNMIYIKNKREKIFVTTEDTSIYQKFEEDIINVELSKKSTQNSTKEIIKTFNGFKGFENIKDVIDKGICEINEHINRNENINGKYPVILNGDSAGVFFHEAIGHLCEADNVTNSQFLQKYIYKGNKISDNNLTIVDDPSLKGHSGSYLYDDEGVKSKPTCIIKEGIVEQILHTRETAALMNEIPTGNGRVDKFFDLPIVRMSNFCIQPGKYSLNELIKSIEIGIYACGNQSGQTKLDQFVFIPKKCYLIKNGEIKCRIPNRYIKGNTFESINSMKLSKEMVWNDSGYCKKQNQDLLPISIYSPSVKLNNISIGG